MSVRDAIVARFDAGEISREIALAQVLLTGEVPDPADLPAPLAALARAHAERLPALAALARAGFDPSDADVLGSTTALFDRLAAHAPEAAVAFYSLGDPALLADATAELVDVIRHWSPVEGKTVLDFGCGIGRVASALAPFAREVVGVDLSAGMVEQARRRAGSSPTLSFHVSDGGPLDLASGRFDLIVAADCMPFVVRAGEEVLHRQFEDFARLLGPAGDLLVFNWSYRGDPDADVAEALMLAERHGFTLLRAGERPFALWDGTGFQLRRTA